MKPKTETSISGTSLSERAMLVNFSTSFFRNTRIDDEVSADVAKRHNADRNTGDYKKRLVEPAEMEVYWGPVRKGWEIHRKYTLPWKDWGSRILSSAGYLPYTKEMREAEAAFWAGAKEFQQHFREYQRAAKIRQNGLYKESDWPDAGQLSAKFGWHLAISPLPEAKDFRVQLADDERNRIQRDMSSWTKDAVDEAMKNIWQRLQAVVSKMSDRLKAYNVTKDGKVEHAFRDTLVTNITEVLDLVPLLNITGDKDVTTFSDRIRKELLRYEPEVLRDNEKARRDTADRADQIVKKMGAFLA